MFHNIKKAAALSLAAFATFTAQAQDNQSGYFVEDYTYRFLMNPAMGNSKNFVAIPALGNLGFGIHGNLGVSDVIYNVDGRTTTFLNPGVSAEEVMGNLSDVNKIGANVRVNILSAGFKAFGGYNTINLAARASVNAHLPKSIFSFLKEGVSNQMYDIKDLRANAIGYGELSLGHSRDITDEIRVGANLKFLVGVAAIDATLDKAELDLDRNSWNVTTNARIHTSIKGMYYKLDRNEHTGLDYVSGLDGDFSAPNGFGLAVDLGATYTPKALKDWQFSLALTDLGFINWSNDLLATTNGDKTFRTDAYTFNPDDDATNSFSSEWKRMRNSLEELYQLETDGNVGSRSQALKLHFTSVPSIPFPSIARLPSVSSTLPALQEHIAGPISVSRPMWHPSRFSHWASMARSAQWAAVSDGSSTCTARASTCSWHRTIHSANWPSRVCPCSLRHLPRWV